MTGDEIEGNADITLDEESSPTDMELRDLQEPLTAEGDENANQTGLHRPEVLKTNPVHTLAQGQCTDTHIANAHGQHINAKVYNFLSVPSFPVPADSPTLGSTLKLDTSISDIGQGKLRQEEPCPGQCRWRGSNCTSRCSL